MPEGPKMLTGTEIRNWIVSQETAVAKSKPGSSDFQINLLLLAMWQMVAELDEIRFTLRKFAPKDTDAESTR